MDYSAEYAGSVAERSLTSATALNGSTLNSLSQDLASGHWERAVDSLMDLRAGFPKLGKHHRRQVKEFMIDGYKPATVNGRFPEPQAIAAEIAMCGPEDTTLVATLQRTLREVRTERALAVAMSGRRQRQVLLTKVDRRIRGKICVRCKGRLKLGEEVYLDRDWGSAWHVAGGCQ